MNSIQKTKSQLIYDIEQLERRIKQFELDSARQSHLTEMLRKFSSVIEQTADQIMITNKAGIIEYVNPAFEKLTGYTSQEVLGKTPRFLKSNRHVPAFYASMWETILAGKPFRGILINRKKNGELYYEEKTITPLKDERGQITHFVSTGKDITKRKMAEENLQQRNRELAFINKASQAFISTLDLDEVLTTVLEGVQQLLAVPMCSAWLLDVDAQEMVCRQVGSPQGQQIIGWRIAVGHGILGWVARQGQSLMLAHIQEDDPHFYRVNQLLGIQIQSVLTVPLKVNHTMIGVLQVVDTTPYRFDQADLNLLESLAATAAIAIDNARLYHQAQSDAETRSVLLQEVNHRVQNNLAAIIGLLYAEQRHVSQRPSMTPECTGLYQSVMTDLINRVQGLAAVHSMLSAAKWKSLPLSQLAEQIIRTALKMVPPHTQVSVNVTPSPVQITSNQAHNLALIINELTINTLKHGTNGLHSVIAVTIEHTPETITLQYRDNGPGYPPNLVDFTLPSHRIGFDLINNVVHRNLRGQLTLHNNQGAVTVITFPNHDKTHLATEATPDYAT